MSRIFGLVGMALMVGCEASQDVVVNEVGVGWVELYNASDESADVSGWSIGFEDQVTDVSGVIPARSVREVALPLEWRIGEVEVTLVVEDVGRSYRDTVTVPVFDTTSAYGLVPDGAPNWQIVDASPGDLNAP